MLFINEYGFHTCVHLWRNCFNITAIEGFLNIQGGIAHVVLHLLVVNSSTLSLVHKSSAGNQALSFVNTTLNNAVPNVFLMMRDNSVYNKASGAPNVRGILNVILVSGDSSMFSSWKLARPSRNIEKRWELCDACCTVGPVEQGSMTDFQLQLILWTELSLSVKFDGGYPRPRWDARRLAYS